MKLLNIAIGLLLTLGVNAQNLSVNQIMEKVEKNEKISSSISTIKQTIITSKGSTRTMTMKGYSKDAGDKQLSIFTGPARVKGDKILMLNGGDDIWFYTPKTDRVRHLASNARKQKVQGSDFSYQDMELRDYKKDFKSKILGTATINGISCYKIESVPTATGPNYTKMIFWIDKTKFVALKTEYYEGNMLLKTMNTSNVKKIGNYWMPMKIVMTNNQTGSKSIIESIDIKINVSIDDSKFTTNYLKQK
ncbi:MAG: outer membrane lipoprotein-sorting protein [Bacteroidales bacterium]|nr:outer membrane lipoprotein-sorting protein [Bacteroidales bacterium]